MNLISQPQRGYMRRKAQAKGEQLSKDRVRADTVQACSTITMSGTQEGAASPGYRGKELFRGKS